MIVNYSYQKQRILYIVTRQEAGKLVWDFAGLNRHAENWMLWGNPPKKAVTKKLEEMAEQLIQALITKGE